MNKQLPTHATGVLQLFSTSRTGIDVFSDQIIESVKEGETSPLQVRVWIKTMEEILERIKKETNQEQITAAEKYSENKFEFAGATLEKADFGKYDYSVCCDPDWEQASADENTAAEKRKARETFLKALQAPIDILHKDTGEVITIKPPVKKSNPGLKVSIR